MGLAVLHSGNLKDISLGGIDKYVKNIIENYEDKIVIYGICHNPDEVGHISNNKINDKEYAFIPICTDKKGPLSLYYTFGMFRYIKEIEEHDFIYAQRIEFALPFFLRKSRKKVSQIIHGSGRYYEISYGKKRYILYAILERIAISIANKTFIIMNNNEYGVPFYKKKYPIYKNRFYFALNPINTDVYKKGDKQQIKKELNLDGYNHIAVYVGRIVDNPKRVLLIPDICNKLKDFNNFLFIIIGEGLDFQPLKERVRIMGLDNKFQFTGYIEESLILAKYYNAADVAINISMYEGTCTTNIEAVACGTPIVSTDVGEIRELVSDHMNGIIIANNQETIAADAAEAIRQIWNYGMPMNDEFRKYECSNAIAKLKMDIQHSAGVDQ